MKKFVLSEMMLLSNKERKAKKIKFTGNRTLIYGKNGTGKSCLIKSIYKTFGATPPADHPTWKELNPISFVRFSVKNVNYSILKDGKFYGVFNSKDKLINVFRSVSNELGPYLANLFDFKLKLQNQQNLIITPPPAFLFLPYYIDQDVSWQNNWRSFAQLQQIKTYREPIVSYHTGIKPNEYYTTKGQIEGYTTRLKELDDERIVLRNVLAKVKEKISNVNFNINIEEFKEEIKQLLIQYDALKQNQERLKSKLVDLYNLKIIAESQLTIAKKTLNDSRKDYNYATNIVVDNSVDCPTCGATYENSFEDRFSLAHDEDRCEELISDLNAEILDIDDKVNKENAIFNKNHEDVLKIESLLEIKRGEVKLQDVIESAGRNEVRNVIENDSYSLIERMTGISVEKKILEDKLRELTDKDRKDKILNLYYSYMKEYLFKLDVKTLDEKYYKRINAKIPETGSALPRALIAYYFSIFQVMKNYTSSVYCPIIIDSPNQQAQDFGHIDKILEFINQNQPDDTQMILGLEELYNVNFNCEIIELKDLESLLQKDEFDDVYNELEYFQSQMWDVRN